jgi:hypothetical protein
MRETDPDHDSEETLPAEWVYQLYVIQMLTLLPHETTY